MPRTPNVFITNNKTAADPTVNDDETEAYDIGSRWVNTTTGKVLFCVDITTGAAVWKDVSTPGAGSHPVTVDTVDPAVTDDSNAGFAIGDHWINSANQRIFQVIDVSVGAAVWDRVDNQGEGLGPSAAVNPGELMFGTLLDYPSAGNSSSGEIQYVRLKLSQGLVLSNMRTFIDSGGSGSRNLRMALYSQTTPGDQDGDPATREVQTNAISTSGANGTFITEAFIGGDFTIPTTGFYWLALITDSPSLKFAVSATHRADFLPTRHESSTGTTLPATVVAVTNPVSAVIYTAGIEA